MGSSATCTSKPSFQRPRIWRQQISVISKPPNQTKVTINYPQFTTKKSKLFFFLNVKHNYSSLTLHPLPNLAPQWYKVLWFLNIGWKISPMLQIYSWYIIRYSHRRILDDNHFVNKMVGIAQLVTDLSWVNSTFF